MPCKFKKGTELSAKMIFSLNAPTNTLKPKVSAKVFGMNMNIDVPKEQQNACAHLENLNCPLQPNQDVIYTVKMPISKSTPTVKTELEINLIGDNNKSHVCFKIDSEIVKG
jgi:ML domain